MSTDHLNIICCALPGHCTSPAVPPVEGKGYKKILDLPDWLRACNNPAKFENNYQNGKIFLPESRSVTSTSTDCGTQSSSQASLTLPAAFWLPEIIVSPGWIYRVTLKRKDGTGNIPGPYFSRRTIHQVLRDRSVVILLLVFRPHILIIGRVREVFRIPHITAGIIFGGHLPRLAIAIPGIVSLTCRAATASCGTFLPSSHPYLTSIHVFPKNKTQ